MLVIRTPGRALPRRRGQVELAEHVVQVDAGPGNDDARARAGRGGAGGRVAVRVDDRDLRRRPDALDRVRELLVAVQPARQPSTVQIAPEARAAHAVLLAHDLDQPGDRLRASRRAAGAEPVDHPQAVADQDAAGRRGRVRLELVPAEDGADGTAPDDAVLLEIAQRDRAAALADVGGDRARHLASVDRARAVLGELLQRVREIALDEPLARDQTPPLRPEHGAPLGAVPQDEVDDGVKVRLRPRQLDPASRELDRRREQLLPRPRPVDAVDVLEPRGRARDRARGRADAEDLRRLDELDVDLLHLPRRRAPSARAPGIVTKKSTSRLVRSRARWTSMNPPPPGPVTGLSTTQETNAAAMQASTALPPSASTRAPASAVRGWPAAIAPLTAQRLRN